MSLINFFTDIIGNRRRKKLFWDQFRLLRKMSKQTSSRFLLSNRDCYPFLDDNQAHTAFDTHYIYHTAWAARILKELNPSLHIDISSSLYFNVLVSSFIPIQFYDFRPANILLDGLCTDRINLVDLSFSDNSVNSLSCMHTLEHIGLGRYGDSIDYDGDLKAMSELKRVLAPGGHLILALPVGKPKIVFNAHRIYNYEQVISNFAEFQLMEFSLIPDNAIETGIVKNATPEQCDSQIYGCGCFLFKKI